MRGYLIDTNILSELRRPKRNPAVLRWFTSVRTEKLYLSVLTLGEIRQGIESLRVRDPKASHAIENWLQILEDQYQDYLLHVDRLVADRWGRLPSRQPIPAIDGLLAATALTHDLIIATRNTADFHRSGVQCVNPFEFGI